MNKLPAAGNGKRTNAQQRDAFNKSRLNPLLMAVMTSERWLYSQNENRDQRQGLFGESVDVFAEISTKQYMWLNL